MNDYKKFGGYTGEIVLERNESAVGTAITFLLIGAAVETVCLTHRWRRQSGANPSLKTGPGTGPGPVSAVREIARFWGMG